LRRSLRLTIQYLSVTTKAIHFGTSGWRAIIGDEFTFEGVRIASRAIAEHLLAQKPGQSAAQEPTENDAQKSASNSGDKTAPHVLVGCDQRFFSPEFARTAARVLRDAGCHASVSRGPVPTPALAYEIRRTSAEGGINITASHNPPEYNGLKFSGSDGGPALPEVTIDLEKRAAALIAQAAKNPDGPGAISSPSAEEIFSKDRSGDEPTFDPRDPYFVQLERLIRFDTIRDSGAKFVYDALHGAGAGYLDEILRRHGIPVTIIRANRDVLFDGAAPDPSDENLGRLRTAVAEEKAVAGLATDGDADRFGIIDRDGTFIQPNHILGLVFDYLIQTRQQSDGPGLGVARSVATTHLLDAIAKANGRPVFETPVGFKYIGAKLLEGKILIGGEESAGMTIAGHVPEKDGVLACLLVAEMIAARRTSLGDQLRDLFHRLGAEFWPVRINIPLPENAIESVHQRLGADFSDFAGRKVARTDRADGLQLNFDDSSWILMRPSGTEPLIRVYAEAGTLDETNKLADDAKKWVLQ